MKKISITSKLVLVVVVCVGLLTGCGGEKSGIDLFKDFKIEFSGTSENGYIKFGQKFDSYQDEEKEVKEFFKTVQYEIAEGSKSGELKNGEEIEMIATYDEEKADELNLTISNKSKKFTVKGLENNHMSYDDISNANREILEKTWDDYYKGIDEFIIEATPYGIQKDTLKIEDKKLATSFFMASKKGRTKIMYVIEATVSGTSTSNPAEEKKKTYYYYVDFNEVNQKEYEGLKKDVFKFQSSTTDKESVEDIKQAIKDANKSYYFSTEEIK